MYIHTHRITLSNEFEMTLILWHKDNIQYSLCLGFSLRERSRGHQIETPSLLPPYSPTSFNNWTDTLPPPTLPSPSFNNWTDTLPPPTPLSPSFNESPGKIHSGTIILWETKHQLRIEGIHHIPTHMHTRVKKMSTSVKQITYDHYTSLFCRGKPGDT